MGCGGGAKTAIRAKRVCRQQCVGNTLGVFVSPAEVGTAQALAIVDLCQQEFGLTGVTFNEVMEQMDACYNFVPTEYTSGKGLPEATNNPAGTNNGSCKVYAFGLVRPQCLAALRGVSSPASGCCEVG